MSEEQAVKKRKFSLLFLLLVPVGLGVGFFIIPDKSPTPISESQYSVAPQSKTIDELTKCLAKGKESREC